jgi:pyruvate kinase
VIVSFWLCSLTLQYHAGTIANARVAAEKLGRPIAIALDTKGPEIRTGLLAGFDTVRIAQCVAVSIFSSPHSTTARTPAWS